jgi:hypothetical protein
VVGGATTGLDHPFAVCVNRSTGQSEALPLAGAPMWDCEAEGLVVNPGDVVQPIVRGVVP